MTETETKIVVQPCEGCGVDVKREVPVLAEPFASLLLAHWHCDACCEQIDAEQQQERDAREHQRAAEDARRRLDASGLPAQHRVRLADLDHEPELIEACRRWADGEIRGLLLTGPVGRGKTTLAGGSAYRMLRRRAVLWTSAPLLFARLGSGFDSDQRQWALDALSGSRALVLDDIDKARPTEYGAEQMFLAVDQRVEHEIPLLVTSNLSPDGIAAHWPSPYGDAIASRLIGYCAVHAVQGVDRRLA